MFKQGSYSVNITGMSQRSQWLDVWIWTLQQSPPLANMVVSHSREVELCPFTALKRSESTTLDTYWFPVSSVLLTWTPRLTVCTTEEQMHDHHLHLYRIHEETWLIEKQTSKQQFYILTPHLLLVDCHLYHIISTFLHYKYINLFPDMITCKKKKKNNNNNNNNTNLQTGTSHLQACCNLS